MHRRTVRHKRRSGSLVSSDEEEVVKKVGRFYADVVNPKTGKKERTLLAKFDPDIQDVNAMRGSLRMYKDLEYEETEE